MNCHFCLFQLDVRISFQSVGVVIAALIIYFYPNLKWVDPVCTFLFSILVLLT